jgi:7-cyano-7-deazaguanine reductase
MFESLGKDTPGPSLHLETFDAPLYVSLVTMESDEVSSVCPVTGQPDLYTVVISYVPGLKCLESKSLKRYLWSFRGQGIFCEDLSARILTDVCAALAPRYCTVTATQKRRGGIQITSMAKMEDI